MCTCAGARHVFEHAKMSFATIMHSLSTIDVAAQVFMRTGKGVDDTQGVLFDGP